MTGIKAHTIRIWEQRYHILSPNRTNTNIRFYKEEDMKHLLNIAFLNRNGYKISRIAGMSLSQLHELVLSLSKNNFDQENLINTLVVAMMDFDEDTIEKVISSNILRSGFEETFFQIVFPLLERIGFLWQTGITLSAHEHFVSNIIRQIIISSSEKQQNNIIKTAPRHLLFLPEKEYYELPLLFINHALKNRRQHTIYLGASVPLKDILVLNEGFKADYIFTSLTSHPNIGDLQNFISTLAEQCNEATIYISGLHVKETMPTLPSNVNYIETIEKAIQTIDRKLIQLALISQS